MLEKLEPAAVKHNTTNTTLSSEIKSASSEQTGTIKQLQASKPSHWKRQKSYCTRSSCRVPHRVPGRQSVKKVFIANSLSLLNPALSLYGSGLVVKPMSWQGHEIQYSVICPSWTCLIINNRPLGLYSGWHQSWQTGFREERRPQRCSGIIHLLCWQMT